MFEQIYVYPATIARHSSAPLAEERKQFLAKCANQGATRGCLRGTAQILLTITIRLKPWKRTIFSLDEIRAAANRWAKRRPKHYSARHTRKSRAHFLHVATQWLMALGRLHVPATPVIPGSHLVDDFEQYMRRERGLSVHTLKTQCWYATQFVRKHYDRDQGLRMISVLQLDQVMTELSTVDGYTRRSLRCAAEALRSFFRHAEFRGWCSPGLAATIRAPRLYEEEGLPTGPAWSDVQRVLADTEGNDPTDVRDRAILLLFAVYGLRSSEVKGLQVGNLDWQKSLIHVPRGKQNRIQIYPLSTTLGGSIRRYLKEVRPQSSYQELFLTVQAPIQPLSRAGLWHIVGRRVRKLNISTKHQGPHSLRHACATHLLAQGMSYKEIGDHLGHRSPKSTQVYAKVDIAGLREVADFDLGGLA